MFFYCATDICIKYAWAVPLKDKKGITFANVFQNILDKLRHKPNKIWVVKAESSTTDKKIMVTRY